MSLHDKASEGVVEHMRRAYAVWPRPTQAMRAAWLGINLEFLDYAPTPLLAALAAQLPAADTSGAPARVRKAPYKFLDYFTEAEADIFCGRDVESQLAFRLALSGRVLTLFGPSGAGKTSLLLAGVLPRLKHEGDSVLYLRALDDPLLALRQAGVGFSRVVRGSDANFINRDRLTLIKLYGDAQQVDTLVVTEY
jgi:hypothetical protein